MSLVKCRVVAEFYSLCRCLNAPVLKLAGDGSYHQMDKAEFSFKLSCRSKHATVNPRWGGVYGFSENTWNVSAGVFTSLQ